MLLIVWAQVITYSEPVIADIQQTSWSAKCGFGSIELTLPRGGRASMILSDGPPIQSAGVDQLVGRLAKSDDPVILCSEQTKHFLFSIHQLPDPAQGKAPFASLGRVQADGSVSVGPPFRSSGD